MASQEHVLLSTEQYNRLMGRIKEFENKHSEINREPRMPPDLSDIGNSGTLVQKEQKNSPNQTNDKSSEDKEPAVLGQSPTLVTKNRTNVSAETPRRKSVPVTTPVNKKLTKTMIKTKLLPPGKRTHPNIAKKKVKKTRKIWVRL